MAVSPTYNLILKTDEAIVRIFGEIDPELSSDEQTKLENYRRNCLRKWLRKGELRGRRIGRDWYIAAAELQRFEQTLALAAYNDG